jgi:Glycosyl transferase family 2
MKKTVITTMKNEGAFLLEWVAHHKALGFDDIVLCTNDCADPTTDMAIRLQKMGLLRHHATYYKPGSSIQRSALRQARRFNQVQQADWIYVCDADEFLTISLGDGTVDALTSAASPDAEVIAVPWRVFGSDGLNDYQDTPITQQFQRAAAAPPTDKPQGAFPKSLFRGGETLASLERLGIHMPIIKPGADRSLRLELPGRVQRLALPQALHVQADFRFAQVNHYCVRSRDSFLVKRDRGKVNHVDKVMEIDYWRRNDSAVEPSLTARRYDIAVAGWMATMQADARLNMLHGRAVNWHRKKITELKTRPDFQDMIIAIEESRAECVSSPS